MPVGLPNRQFSLNSLDTVSSGKPVILLHGLGSNSSSWSLQVPLLKQNGFRVLAPDLPGFGKSPAIKGHISIKEIARYLAFWLENNIDSPAAIIGLSLGGVAALQLTLDFPHYVHQLCLVSAFARFEPANARSWGYMLQRFIILNLFGIEAQAEIVARHIFPGAESESLRRELRSQIISSDKRTYRSTMISLARFNVLDRLETIACPTMVVSGDQDKTVQLKAQKKLASGIKNVRHVVIPGSGHAVPVQNPEKFNPLMIQFLLETEPCH